MPKETQRFGRPVGTTAASADGFGQRLTRARIGRDLSQQELGGLIGVSASLIGQYEAGKLVPTQHRIVELAEVLDTTPGKLAPEYWRRCRVCGQKPRPKKKSQ